MSVNVVDEAIFLDRSQLPMAWDRLDHNRILARALSMTCQNISRPFLTTDSMPGPLVTVTG